MTDPRTTRMKKMSLKFNLPPFKRHSKQKITIIAEPDSQAGYVYFIFSSLATFLKVSDFVLGTASHGAGVVTELLGGKVQAFSILM